MASTFINIPAAKALNASRDSVAISDGTDQLAVNADGSINVVVADSSYETPINKFGEVGAVASSLETTIVSHTAVIGAASFLQRASFSGTNISEYRLKINGTTVDKFYTDFGGGLSGQMEFSFQSNRGYALTEGDLVTITTVHNRPFLGAFNARLQLIEVY